MKKPRVLFPFVESGLGHITPMQSIYDCFSERYGDVVECVPTYFFRDSNDRQLVNFEKKMVKFVRDMNSNASYGFLHTGLMNNVNAKTVIEGSMFLLEPQIFAKGSKYMESFDVDLVFSTHYSTNTLAKKCADKPLTVQYCPDIIVSPLYCYDSDLNLVSSDYGLKNALKEYPDRFNKSNLKKVNLPLRKEAFDKRPNRNELCKQLGLPTDKFTVILVEGGYGIGKMEQICKNVIERDLPVTLVPICGKNEKLYKQLLTWKTHGKTTFCPIGFCENIFDYYAVADLFCGKSGNNMMAEPTYFGLPIIITKFASGIEEDIGNFYINDVGNAIKIFDIKSIVDKIEEFAYNPELLEQYKSSAENFHNNFGSTKSASYIYNLLRTRFTSLPERA